MHESGIGPYGLRNRQSEKRNGTLRPMGQPALADPIVNGADIGRIAIRAARFIPPALTAAAWRSSCAAPPASAPLPAGVAAPVPSQHRRR